jgi:hypothetical protein
MPRARLVIKIAVAAGVGLWAYQFGFTGSFESEQGPLAVSRLVFAERTFRYSSPFFFQAGQPASLFVASAPPGALPPGAKVWRVAGAGSGVRAVEADAAAGVSAFQALPNGLAAADAGIGAACGEESGQDLGGAVIPAEGLRIQLRFRGLHFRKPVLGLFSIGGPASGLRMVDVFFGGRTISVCRGPAVIAKFSQKLWNVPSAVRLPDLAYLIPEYRLLFITGEAAKSNAILAVQY